MPFPEYKLIFHHLVDILNELYSANGVLKYSQIWLSWIFFSRIATAKMREMIGLMNVNSALLIVHTASAAKMEWLLTTRPEVLR